MRLIVRTLILLASIVLIPTVVSAQAVIAGAVKRFVRRCAAGRDRRSGQPCAD